MIIQKLIRYELYENYGRFPLTHYGTSGSFRKFKDKQEMLTQTDTIKNPKNKQSITCFTCEHYNSYTN